MLTICPAIFQKAVKRFPHSSSCQHFLIHPHWGIFSKSSNFSGGTVSQSAKMTEKYVFFHLVGMAWTRPESQACGPCKDFTKKTT